MIKREFGIGLLRGTLFWLVLCMCIWQFTINIPTPYLALYVKQLNGSAADVGLVRSVASIACMLIFPVGGYIADKAGRVKLVSISTAAYAFGFIPFALAPNWQTLVLASFIQNMMNFSAPILIVLLADSMPVGRRGQGFAIALSIPSAISVVSPYLGGYLIDTLGVLPTMKMMYLVAFGVGLSTAAIRWLTLKETIDASKTEKLDYRNTPHILKNSYRSIIETLKWMPDQVRTLATIQTMEIFFVGMASSYWILYATGVIGLKATEWGITSTIQGLSNLAVAVPAGILMDRYGRRKLLLPILVTVPFYPLIFLRVIDLPGLSLLAVLIAVSNAFLMPGFQSLLSDNTPRERRGRVISGIGSGNFFIDIRGMMFGGGMIQFMPLSVAQVAGGILYEVNPTIPFLVMAAGMAVVTIFAFFKVRDPKEIET